MLFSDVTDDYLRCIAHERKVSPTTTACYKAWLHHFEKWLTDNDYPQPATLEQFTTPILRRYQQELSAERKYRPRTILGAFYPLRGMGDYLVQNRVISDNPVRHLTMPKKDAAVRKVVSQEEILQMLDVCDKQRNKTRIAYERALLCTLVYTGIRAAEFLDMRIEHVDVGARTLLIPNGKGSKSRLLYLTDECADALREWLRVRPAAKHDWVWFSDVRRRISVETLRRDLEDIKARAGLVHARWIQPHSIRHAFATRMMVNGANIRSIQAALGHSDAQTTLIYLHHSETPAIDMKNAAAFPKPAVETNKPTKAMFVQQMRRRHTR
jgi:site-specific recombinase XerD